MGIKSSRTQVKGKRQRRRAQRRKGQQREESKKAVRKGSECIKGSEE